MKESAATTVLEQQLQQMPESCSWLNESPRCSRLAHKSRDTITMERRAVVPILQSNDFEKEESAAKRVDSFMDEVSEFREAGAPDADRN